MVLQAWHAVTNRRLCARTFGLDIGIIGALSAWRCCECELNEKLQTHLHVSLRWPIRDHFRWSCLRISRVCLGGSSDSCRLCQFLWDSAEQTAHATRATGKWQMVSSGVDMCLLVKTYRDSNASRLRIPCIESVSLLHLRYISTHVI